MAKLNTSNTMLIGIISIPPAGIPLGLHNYLTIFSLPTSLEPVAFKFDFSELITPGTLSFIFVFFIGDFFDTDDTITPLSIMSITGFSGSIANGIAVGLILYTFIKIVLGKTKEL